MIAAPFLAEFGWEVALWAPWLRYVRQEHYKQQDFTVFCQEGHQGLYEDFADTKAFNLHKVITHVDCQHVWVQGERAKRRAYAHMCSAPLGRVLTPLDLTYTWKDGFPPRPNKQAAFRNYGISKTDDQLIAIHARSCEKQTERNWSIPKWVKLVESFGDRNVASVGLPKDAMHIPGTEDMLGVPLTELTNILSACRFVVGPSSGPLALAMHCGTDVVWWSRNTKDVTRFLSYWNPFEVTTLRADGSWNPSLEKVEAACAKFS